LVRQSRRGHRPARRPQDADDVEQPIRAPHGGLLGRKRS
jgi:hypothetical protein